MSHSFPQRFSLALALCLLLWPRSAGADPKPPAATGDGVETRTGQFQAHWAKPTGTELAQRIQWVYDRYGWAIPQKPREDLLTQLRNSTQGDSLNDKGDKGDPLDPKADPLAPKATAALDDDSSFTYEVYVPESYKPGKKYGLMIWVSTNDKPTLPDDWPKVLDARRLIFIAPHDLGGLRNADYPAYMTFETLAHAQKAFSIDDQRIYIGGVGLGGDVASMVAEAFPDIIQGALCGGEFRMYKAVPNGSRGRTYRGFWDKPEEDLLNLDRHQSRFALVADDKGSHSDYASAIYDAMMRDGFAGVTLLKATDPRKSLDADTFDKAMEALDAPLTAKAQQQYKDALAAEKSHRPDAAFAAYSAAAAHGGSASFVPDADAKAAAIFAQYQSDLAQIEQFITDRQFEKAVAATNKLRQAWPTLAKEKSVELLHRIGEARSAKK